MKEEQAVESGISLVELFNMLFRNIYLIIFLTVITTILGVVYTFGLVKPTYAASSDIMVQVDKTSGSGETTNDIDLTSTLRIVQTVSEFVEKDFVIESVIDELGLEITPSNLRNNLSVKYSSTSLFITIKYTDIDPDIAKRVVNTLIKNAIQIANDEFPVLNNVMVQAGLAKKGTYASPNKLLNIIISIIIGVVIGVGTALVIEFLKTTVRNKKELEALISEYQVIGVIPLMSNENNGEQNG